MKPVLSIVVRGNLVLNRWCGAAPAAIDQGMTLANLWDSTRKNPQHPHQGLDFQPEGVQDLLLKLNQEFEGTGDSRKKTSVLTLASFKPAGDIDKVKDLHSAVIGCPNLPPTPHQ